MSQVDIRSTSGHALCCATGNLARRAPRVGLKGGRYLGHTAAERLAARTVQGPTCWLVRGHALPNGYCLIYTHRSAEGKPQFKLAHRFAWELAHGEIPAGRVICHTCDTPRCVNPAHLFLGTQGDNVADSVAKGRHGAHLRTGLRLNGQPSRRLGAARAREAVAS